MKPAFIVICPDLDGNDHAIYFCSIKGTGTKRLIVGAYYIDFLGLRKLSPYRLTQIKTYLTRSSVISKETTPSAIRCAMKSLVKEGWLTEKMTNSTDAKAILENKKPQIFQDCGLKCSWCFGTTTRLEKHHYPIPKREGGIEMVDICPSCHSEFHFLVDSPSYRPSEKLLREFRSSLLNEPAQRLKQLFTGEIKYVQPRLGFVEAVINEKNALSTSKA
jgi:hypothetical protein